MKHIVAFFAILLFCVAAAGDDAQIVRQVTDMDTILQAATAHYDSATISAFMTNDYTLVSNSGDVWNKRTFLEVVANRAAVRRSVDPSDLSVRSYNGDCAIVVGLLHVKYTLRGKTENQLVRFTDTWVKRDGSWHYAAGQGTLYKEL